MRAYAKREFLNHQSVADAWILAAYQVIQSQNRGLDALPRVAFPHQLLTQFYGGGPLGPIHLRGRQLWQNVYAWRVDPATEIVRPGALSLIRGRCE